MRKLLGSRNALSIQWQHSLNSPSLVKSCRVVVVVKPPAVLGDWLPHDFGTEAEKDAQRGSKVVGKKIRT